MNEQAIVSDQLKVLLCGDLNDLRTHVTATSETFNLGNIVTFPTRGTQTLDLVLTNIERYQSAEKMTPLGRSDHVAVICKPIAPQLTRRYKKVVFRPLTKTRKLKFGIAVVEQEWMHIVKPESRPDEKAEMLLATLTSICTWAFPTKTIRMRI